MTKSSLWLPADATAERTLTSATLDEAPGAPDRLELYVHGEKVAAFELPAGQGAAFLADCGLAKVERL